MLSPYLVFSHVVLSSAPVVELPPITCLEELVRMDECQLRDLYQAAAPGPVPHGYAPGRAIPSPGSRKTVRKSNVLKHVWQGKNFGADGIMTNSMFGVKMIKGVVGEDASWLDGKPAQIIDYSPTSLVFRPYRDEFREVAPGIYLGMMWKRDDCHPKLLTWFALDARCK